MRRGGAAVAALLAAMAALLHACGGGSVGGSGAFRDFNPGRAPAEYHQGEVIFNTYCMSCHGLYGRGEGLGPSLLDTLYLPARLSDDAILAAVERGVTQHNFHFGAMPAVKRLTPPEGVLVLGYVRWLQERWAPGGRPDSLGAR